MYIVRCLVLRLFVNRLLLFKWQTIPFNRKTVHYIGMICTHAILAIILLLYYTTTNFSKMYVIILFCCVLIFKSNITDRDIFIDTWCHQKTTLLIARCHTSRALCTNLSWHLLITNMLSRSHVLLVFDCSQLWHNCPVRER